MVEGALYLASRQISEDSEEQAKHSSSQSSPSKPVKELRSPGGSFLGATQDPEGTQQHRDDSSEWGGNKTGGSRHAG